jgi:hypothetical protein
MITQRSPASSCSISLAGLKGIGRSVVVDEDVYQWAKEYRWYFSKSTTGAARVYAAPRANEPIIHLARVVSNAGPEDYPRFIDGDGLNCTRGNIVLERDRNLAGRPVNEDLEARACRVRPPCTVPLHHRPYSKMDAE